MLGQVSFLSARHAGIKLRRRLKAHQVGGAHMRICPGDGKGDTLVLADGTVEDHVFIGVLNRALDKPVAFADRQNGFRTVTC